MLPIESVLAELGRFDGAPTLTVYLRTDSFRGVPLQLAAALAELVEPVRSQLPWRGQEAAAFEAEVRVVQDRLASVLPGQRGMAVFSCSRRHFYRALPLEVAIPATVRWGGRFSLKPLQAALERAERVYFLLLGHERTRLFRIMWNEIEEPAQPASVDPAGAAALLTAVVRRERVDRLLVGGAPAMLPRLAELLPAEMARRLEECGPLPIDAPSSRVLEAALECLWRTQRARDERLVDDLLHAVARGQAAVGPGAVAEALAVGDVGRLVVPEGLHLGGGVCPGCGLLSPAPAPHFCPACGGPLRTVTDLVERMEARVARGGGSIDEVGGHAAATLAEHEGIGAFLRSPPVPAGA